MRGGWLGSNSRCRTSRGASTSEPCVRRVTSARRRRLMGSVSARRRCGRGSKAGRSVGPTPRRRLPSTGRIPSHSSAVRQSPESRRRPTTACGAPLIASGSGAWRRSSTSFCGVLEVTNPTATSLSPTSRRLLQHLSPALQPRTNLRTKRKAAGGQPERVRRPQHRLALPLAQLHRPVVCQTGLLDRRFTCTPKETGRRRSSRGIAPQPRAVTPGRRAVYVFSA